MPAGRGPVLSYRPAAWHGAGVPVSSCGWLLLARGDSISQWSGLGRLVVAPFDVVGVGVVQHQYHPLSVVRRSSMARLGAAEWASNTTTTATAAAAPDDE